MSRTETVTTDSTKVREPVTQGTRNLLVSGVVAGPCYVVVSLAQALTRDGFDPARHAWSMLANGGAGWIQVANLAVSGLLVVAGAIGLRRVLTPGKGSALAGRLLSGYGLGMVAAAVFLCDPGDRGSCPILVGRDVSHGPVASPPVPGREDDWRIPGTRGVRFLSNAQDR